MNLLETLLNEYNSLTTELRDVKELLKPLTVRDKELKQKIGDIELAIDENMQANKKIKDAAFGYDLSYRKSYQTIITDEGAIPMAFFEVIKKPKLLEIKEAIEKGEISEGAEIKEVQNIQIKKRK